MKVCVLLCVCFLNLTMATASRYYLVTAPQSLRVDAVETVLVHLWGYSEEVTLHVFLRTSMAEEQQPLSHEVLTLNANNHHQGVATVRLLPQQLDKSMSHVTLHIQSADINSHVSLPVSRSNGFLFIQSDKPLYTPMEGVKVRVFSLNQELRPANRSVFLTFKDPDHSTVDIVEIKDLNNGLPSMQNPFKIPIKPKLGIWTIRASYSEDFSTQAQTDFEVKEYVLPRLTISIQPEASYIHRERFNRFNFILSARYLHGAPVSNAEVFLRYGYLSNNNPPVIIPDSVRRDRLSDSGEVSVTVNLEQLFSSHSGGLMDFTRLTGKYLYITALVKESIGEIRQEFEFAGVKFVKVPFTLSLISTPPFIKPRLPYNIQVQVKDHLDKPVSQVPVRLLQRHVFGAEQHSQDMSCSPEAPISQSDGLVVFTCNVPPKAVRAELMLQTADPSLPTDSQARLSLRAQAYHSLNQRYLYIDPPGGSALTVGRFAHINIYSATPEYITVGTISYMVLSRGRVLTYGTQSFSEGTRHTLSFLLTPAMFPSIRLLVYYLPVSAGRSELVADSVWLDVRDACVNGLKTELSVEGHPQSYRPAEKLTLNIRTNQDGLVALSAVDSALLQQKPNFRDPVTMVVQRIEQSDPGCGGGGGKDATDVFRMAGLHVVTDTVAQPAGSTPSCTKSMRPKRAINDNIKTLKAASYGPAKKCCELGMKFLPTSVSCQQQALQSFREKPLCKQAFRECCEFVLQDQDLDQDQDLGLLPRRRKRSLSQEDKLNKAASYGPAKKCCELGMKFVPTSVSCQQQALQSFREKPLCKQAFRECCEFVLQDQDLDQDQDLGLLPRRRKRSLSQEDKLNKAASYGPAKKCCELGMKFVPTSVSCQQQALQSFREKPLCKQAFRECCEFVLQDLDQDQDLILGRHDLGPDSDQVPVLVRSSFPESWLWDVRPIWSGQLSVTETLPHSITTWEIRAVGMFGNGICAAHPVQVSVSLPLSMDIPLPYQVVRGEQVELKGSVYNQKTDSVEYCVTLRAGPAVCLHQSQPAADGQQSTACSWRHLPAGSVSGVSFTLLGHEPGEHTLTFSLMTRGGGGDVLQKKLRVVPEGTRQEVFSAGTLDPHGVYGAERRMVQLRSSLPPNMVPNVMVEKQLTISGEVLGDILTLIVSGDGLQQLIDLPAGSAQAELGRLRLLLHVYRYLETSRSWNLLGRDVQRSAEDLKEKIKESVVSISSFKKEDFGYSMWRDKKSSTWMTASVLQTLFLVHEIIPLNRQALSESVSWLIRNTQRSNGSFVELSSFRANRIMDNEAEPEERGVYLTSLGLITLKRAMSVDYQPLQLKIHEDSRASAERYISQHAPGVKSVYVRALATFALTFTNPRKEESIQLLKDLEGLALEKGHPAELRFWKDVDKFNERSVETTALVLLTALLRGRLGYAKPILHWLTQNQDYGQGFFSTEGVVLTLEALTEYSRVTSKADLKLDISVRIGQKKDRQVISLSSRRPVATPIQVTTNDDITVSTGYGSGVSAVKLKTVFYQTSPSSPQTTCNFELSIQTMKADPNNRQGLRAPHLVACTKYTPLPNSYLESTLTIMKIQLPTGMEAFLDDLRQFTGSENPLISNYELKGNTVVIQAERIPSDVFLCVGFRIRTSFRVDGAAQALFTVSEPSVKGSLCTKQFSNEQTVLQRLCVGEQCQCVTAACATFRGEGNTSLTVTDHKTETCQPHIRYAYKVSVKSSEAEGDFWTFKATVDEVVKKDDEILLSVTATSEVELVKKTTCHEVHLQIGHQYLLMGASRLEVKGQTKSRYRLALDSDAVLEEWPTKCSSPQCVDYISQLDEFMADLQLWGC